MKPEQLHTLFMQCNSVSTDTRKIEKNDIFFALKGDNFNGNSYAQQALENGAKYAIIDEEEYNTSPKTILVDNALQALQQLAYFHRKYLSIPIIALTGSNGKTTTKELIHATLSQKYKTTATVGNLNNHIGVPLTLLSMSKSTEIGIVEMGANHQKEIAFLCTIAQPDFGYITNFGKAHLEGFGGVKGVIKGKSEMYDYLIGDNKTIFVNGDDPIQIEKTTCADRFVFGKTNPDFNLNIDFIEALPFVKSSYNSLEIKSHLIGDYNFSNIAVAIAMGYYFKVDDKNIKAAIEGYVPTNNRSQIIERHSNEIVLDAYNANPSSMEAALLNFDKSPNPEKIVCLGDMFELGQDARKEHQNIADLAISLSFTKVLFIGENFFDSKITSDKSLQFKSFNDFKVWVMNSNIENTSILIKGSRGMALERILDFI